MLRIYGCVLHRGTKIICKGVVGCALRQYWEFLDAWWVALAHMLRLRPIAIFRVRRNLPPD